MAYLAEFEKQSGETQDYDVDFADYLDAFNDGDSVISFTVTVPTGITKTAASLNGKSVKVWLSGGTSGQKYHVTATITTNLGRVKEGDIAIKVRDV